MLDGETARSRQVELGARSGDRVAVRAGLKAGRTPEQLAAEWKRPEKYKGYSADVSPLMGGFVGRIQTLQKEIQ